MADKKFFYIVYGLYLAAVCGLSGIWSAVTVADVLTTTLDIVWPPQVSEANLEYYVPASVRDLVENALHLVISVPIFAWHIRLMLKEIKNK